MNFFLSKNILKEQLGIVNFVMAFSIFFLLQIYILTPISYYMRSKITATFKIVFVPCHISDLQTEKTSLFSYSHFQMILPIVLCHGILLKK